MKKIILPIVGTIMLILAGCAADTAAEPTDIAAVGISAIETAAREGVSESTPEENGELAEKEESAPALAKTKAAISSAGSDAAKEAEVATGSNTASPASSKSKSAKAATSKSSASAGKAKQKQSAAKNETPKKKQSSKPTKPKPAPKPSKPKTAYDAPYDKDAIIANAKTYGESIGMTWSAPLTKDNCSWETPFQTSDVLSGARLKRAIEYGIQRAKKLQSDNGYQPGEFHFKLYLEAYGDGEYSVYHLIG
jgi:hypothetical protein